MLENNADRIERINLLSMPVWKKEHVQKYFGVGKKTAQSFIDNAIIRCNGTVIDNPAKATSESIIQLVCGHSKAKEMAALTAGLEKEYEKRI